MRRDLLELLAKELETADEKSEILCGNVHIQFNMQAWMQRVPPKNVDRHRWQARQCGTNACAAGLASLLPPIREEGLVMKYDPSYMMLIPKNRYTGSLMYEALEEVFELTGREVGLIFDPTTYPESKLHHPFYAAARIRNVMNGVKITDNPSEQEDPDS